MNELQKSYYAIIPANVRYDNDLTPNAKLLYGEITALCNEKGYCWASNNYFAELYKVSKKSISKWINQLIQKGYIKSQIMYKEGSKSIEERRLYISNPMEEKFHTPSPKVLYPMEEKFHTPMEEKVKDNNTYINNTNNNTVISLDDIDNIWKLYPNKKDKTKAYKYIKRILTKEKISVEELERAVKRYAKEKENTDKQYIKHGSTFFNGAYIDYLDENYQPSESVQPTTKIESSLDLLDLINGPGE
ncbi:helix-turn-helix domain-containing protein [Intestinibacter bartlettii]|uniref:helix-turn-helix domain-containing protein n=1 Tax=Intestinibacter bartlettii TaxID=261299 RepID=UPI002675E073|nr:helix-turn-helix domain-containing protein [Intestinibacter bartlettii]